MCQVVSEIWKEMHAHKQMYPTRGMCNRVTPDVHFFEMLIRWAVLDATFHADSNEHKLFDDFEYPEGVDSDCLNQLLRISSHF